MSGLPVVSLLIFLPLIAALVCLLLPADSAGLARPLALAVALVTLVIAAVALAGYQGATPGLAYEERVAWAPSLGISYHLGLDGLNILLVALTALLTVVALLTSWERMAERPRLFAALLLLLEGTVIGALSAVDLILYFVFWEAMLIPMYLLIGAFGGARRGYAALKFFIYTSVGSLLMLLAILATAFLHGGAPASFDLADLAGGAMSLGAQRWLFLAFALAFAIKLPLFPLHSWLPDAYTQAPVTVLVLATMLVKVGAYSFFRFAIPLFPQAAAELMPSLAVLATIGIIYGGVIAARQRDIVRLLAFSSISHLGFIGLGIFALDRQAAQGSILQMVNHGLSSGALFVIAALLLARTGTLDLTSLGGLAKRWPVLAACFMLATFSSLGLPGLNGFVGEFLILLGAFQTERVLAVIASFGVLLAAIYLLRLFRSTMHGPEVAPTGEGLVTSDLTARELLALAPLLVLIVWIGVYPAPFLRRTEGAVTQVLATVQAARTHPTMTVRLAPCPHDGQPASDCPSEARSAAWASPSRR